MLFADIPRICITSTCGGGGKTLLSLGLGRALYRAGHNVIPFKKGPDYIDAAWLSLACGIQATNLDPFFMDSESLLALFTETIAREKIKNRPIALLEGNRGFYDGLDESGSCSTSSLARTLQCPVVLCINCVKTTRTIAALIKGMENFEADINFCGVVLNKIGSTRHESALRKVIEANTDLKVLGALPRLESNPLPERHMGLASRGSSLAEKASLKIDKIAEIVSRCCDLDAIACAAQQAPILRLNNRVCGDAPINTHQDHAKNQDKPVIGYVHDDALWFYYPENLRSLEEAGAKLQSLSLLDRSENNQSAWKKLDGLYLGGGFPEDFAEELAKSPFLAQIAAYAKEGMPVYAECGGLMLLCGNLVLPSGSWPMSGVFAADVEWSSKPRGLGYVEARVLAENPFFPRGMKLRGHEFHYSGCFWNGVAPEFALKLVRGTGIAAKGCGRGMDGLVYKNVWGSYTHIFAPAVPAWAPNFVAAASVWKKNRQ